MAIGAGLLMLAGSTAWLAGFPRADTAAGSDTAARAKIVRFVRAKFGVPDSTKLTADPFAPSPHPDFMTTAIHRESQDCGPIRAVAAPGIHDHDHNLG